MSTARGEYAWNAPWRAGFTLLVAHVPARPPRKIVYLYPPEGSTRQVTHLRGTPVAEFQRGSLREYQACLNCERFFKVTLAGEPVSAFCCSRTCHMRHAGIRAEEGETPDFETTRKRRRKALPPDEAQETAATETVLVDGQADEPAVPAAEEA